jgi:autotransporter-associated beta strand protein
MKAKEKANRTKCGNNLRMQFSGLERDPGATIDFDLSPGAQVSFASPPTLTNGIIGAWATAGDNWATIQPGTGQVAALSTYNTNPSPSTWVSSDNVSVDSNVTVLGDTVVNSFRLDATKSHDDEVVKTFGTKGIMVVGAGSTLVHGSGSITTPAGSSELIIHTRDQFGNVRIDIPITDNGAPVSLTKDGEGTLELHGDNTYTGSTKVSRSVLKSYFQAGDKPTQSQFSVARGATFELGSSAGAIAGLEGDGKVQLNSNTLTFGHNNASTSFGGEILGAGGSITKVGDGEFTLTAISTFSGDATVAGGTIVLDGDGALANVRQVRIRGGSTAQLSRVLIKPPNHNPSARIADDAVIDIAGGTLQFVAGSTPYTENVGTLKSSQIGTATITATVTPASAKGTIRFTGDDFQGRHPGATFSFQNLGANAEVVFASPPTLTHEIIGAFATVDESDWASTQVCPGGYRVWPLPGYWNDTASSTWDPSKNVSLSSPVQVTLSASPNTVKLSAGALITLTGQNFLSTGGLLATGNSSITGSGSLRAQGNTPLAASIRTGSTLSITVPVTDGSGITTSLVKSGGGTLVLGGNNTFTGDCYVKPGRRHRRARRRPGRQLPSPVAHDAHYLRRPRSQCRGAFGRGADRLQFRHDVDRQQQPLGRLRRHDLRARRRGDSSR